MLEHGCRPAIERPPRVKPERIRTGARWISATLSRVSSGIVMQSDWRFAPFCTDEMEQRRNVNSEGDRDMSDYQMLKAAKYVPPTSRNKNTAWVWLLAALAFLVAIGIATS